MQNLLPNASVCILLTANTQPCGKHTDGRFFCVFVCNISYINQALKQINLPWEEKDATYLLNTESLSVFHIKWNNAMCSVFKMQVQLSQMWQCQWKATSGRRNITPGAEAPPKKTRKYTNKSVKNVFKKLKITNFTQLNSDLFYTQI